MNARFLQLQAKNEHVRSRERRRSERRKLSVFWLKSCALSAFQHCFECISTFKAIIMFPIAARMAGRSVGAWSFEGGHKHEACGDSLDASGACSAYA